MRSRPKVPVRVLAIVAALAALVCLMSGCAANSKRLVGAWELVEPRMDGPEADSLAGEPAVNAGAYVPVKILTDSYFAFGCVAPLELVYGGGGRYTYDGLGRYSEYIRYHSFPYLVGTRVDFTCRLEGDLWYHDGAYTLNGETREIHEVWRRLPDSAPAAADGSNVKWRQPPENPETTQARSSDRLSR